MSRNLRWSAVSGIAGLAFCFIAVAAAPSAQGQYPQGSQTPPPQQSDKSKTPETTPLTLDAPAPVNAEEDAAYKAFQAVPQADLNKRIELGEAFVQKYPQSRYLPPIYSALTISYLQTNQVQKMLAVGEKEVQLTPNDVTTLAILAQTISRVTSSNTPDAAKQLDKAASYAKKAIEIVPTLPKPENLTDEAFSAAKNQTLATAHSGLGLVLVKQGKSGDAIPELEQAVKMDPNPDPVNFYVLGIANKSASHFDDAVTAFTKCAAMPGGMQATCKAQAEDAKKQGATQLSAPK